LRAIFRNPWVRLLLLVSLLVLFVRALVELRHVLAPFAVGFALAYFLNPPVNALTAFFARVLGRAPGLRGRLEPRTAAVMVLVVAVSAVLLWSLLVVVPAAGHQVADTAAKLPEYARNFRARVEPTIERLNLRYPEQAELVRQRIEETLRENLPEIMAPVSHAVRAAFSSLLSLVLAALHLVVIPVFAVYLLHDMNRIREGAKDLVPHRHRDYVYSRLRRVDDQLAAFARGQVTVCLMLGVFYAIALTVLNVPMGLVVGFAIGFFNLIPYMSLILGLPLALLLTWLADPEGTKLLVVAGLFATVQFIEGHFVTPRIVGGKLGLHAVVIMLAVLVGGTLFGFVGMLVAVPVTACLSVFWDDLKEAYVRSAFFRGEDVRGEDVLPPGPVV
jgi:predicted PurR-regulated permease PerM